MYRRLRPSQEYVGFAPRQMEGIDGGSGVISGFEGIDGESGCISGFEAIVEIMGPFQGLLVVIRGVGFYTLVM